MKRTLTSAFSTVLGAKSAVMVVNVAVTPILVRLLGATGYGMYATLLAAFGLVQILMSSGITGGVMKYLSENRPDSYWKDHVFGYYFRVATALAVAVSLGLVLAASFGLVERLFGSEYTPYVYVLAAFAIVSQYKDFLIHSLMGLHLERYSEPLRVVNRVVFAIVSVGLLYVGYGVGGVLVGHIVAGGIVCILALSVIRRRIPVSSIIERVPETFPKRELLDFNHLTVVYFALFTSLYHVDVLLLEGFTSSDQVGHYKAALVVVEFLWVVPYSLQMILVQSVSDLWYSDDVARISTLASQSTRYVLLLSGLFAIGLAALADVFVPLYFGADFSPTITPLLILLPGAVGFAVARPISAISLAKGDLRPLVVAAGTAAVLNLLLNLALIPTFGTAGAAFATTIGYGSLPVLLTVTAWQLGYRPFAEARLGRIALTVVLACPLILLLESQIRGTLASFAIVPPAGLAIFSVIALGTNAIDYDEIGEATVKVTTAYSDLKHRFNW